MVCIGPGLAALGVKGFKEEEPEEIEDEEDNQW